MTRKAESGEPPISTLLDTSAPPTLEDWGFEEDKAFENALAEHWFDDAKWDKIASMLPSKDCSDVEQRYLILEEDISSIESGSISLPAYTNSVQPEQPAPAVQAIVPQPAVKRKAPDQERRKGIPWTEEEHRAFLMGLAKFGKGDWRSISRSFVVSRTPTQVASHAQKYFIRLNSMNKKDKRRSSIHDITSATPPAGGEVPGVMPQFAAPNMAMPGGMPLPPAMGMGAGGPVQW